MRLRRSIITVPVVLAAFAGGQAIAASTGHHATVDTAHAGKLGTILVDSHGRTLYLFEKDKHGRSSCSGACAQNWPPVLVSGKPTAGRGAKASRLGTTMRSGGKKQVTYDGHPLYRFSGDTKAGETKGQDLKGFGAEWYVVSPAGKAID